MQLIIFIMHLSCKNLSLYSASVLESMNSIMQKPQPIFSQCPWKY